MLNILTPNDFPLLSIGAEVYRRGYSSPLFTAPSAGIAADLVFRLNAHEAAKNSNLQSFNFYLPFEDQEYYRRNP